MESGFSIAQVRADSLKSCLSDCVLTGIALMCTSHEGFRRHISWLLELRFTELLYVLPCEIVYLSF